MERPSKTQLLEGAIKFWLLSQKQEIVELNNNFNLSTKEGEMLIGYLFMIDITNEKTLEIINNNSDTYNRIYLVYNSEKRYNEDKNKIPSNIGMIVCDNLYGFGNMIKVMRESTINDVAYGYDLPEKKCSCRTTMQGDGMNIHYEALYGFTGDKVPNITLNLSKEMQNIISNKFENEYNINVAFTSTVSTISETHGLRLISEYENKTGKDFTEDEKRQIINELSKVKKADGINPACLMLFPKDKEILDFTPINEDKYNGLPITHFRHYDLWDAVPYLEIMPTDFCDFLQTLEFETGVNINDVPVNAKTLLELAKNDDLDGITEFGTEYVSKMIKVANPQTFSDLIKINGLAHGTGTWENNAEDLLKNGICKLSDIPATRDDIYNDLVSHGLEKDKAFYYSEIVRKGFLAKGRLSDEEVKEFENALTTIGMPDWYAKYCEKNLYMFPKAHACEYTQTAVIEAWYKNKYPDLYKSLFE